MTPRVRFAPSPTGYLHVGGARTALFNWLYARRHGGVFVLRIEDTDAERSSADMVTGILDGLRWLGLDWDEGPLVAAPTSRTSSRSGSIGIERPRSACTTTVTRTLLLLPRTPACRARGGGSQRRGVAVRPGLPEPVRRRSGGAGRQGTPRALRFKVRQGRTSFDDAVHGTITFDSANIEDFVILRSDGHPTYHLSVVVDDVEMAITHVIRGDDHISNTPKHVLLFEAMGAPIPRFAHVPLILGADKKRLSKRHGATSVMEYERQGYFSAAMVNFLALLGWSPGDDRELLSKTELIEAFSLKAISGGNAVFNTEKLDWMNGQYIGRMSADELSAALASRLAEAGLSDARIVRDPERFGRLLELLRPRAKRLPDFIEQARPLLMDEVVYTKEAVEKHLSSPDLSQHISALRNALATADPFDEPTLETTLRSVAEALGLKAGALIHAARVAVTGRTTSPGLFEMLALLGRETVVARLDRLEQFLLARA